eukprot:m.33029 g.33029  ORF g.33029 m.33029 type:complete len:1422 (+) comp9569_c2_seq1:216-4481(+)
MGNQITTAPKQVQPIESYLVNLPQGYTFDKTLHTTRFLKTVRTKHRNSYRVVKLFIKHDTGVDLSEYKVEIDKLKRQLKTLPHTVSYEKTIETQTCALLIRHYMYSDLESRITTRPFLSRVEKRWVCYQLLMCLRDCHEYGVHHGDIKIDNILVSSWLWVYLSDFANFKPALLPDDNPTGFSYFYDASGKRSCNIAPERFYTPAKSQGAAQSVKDEIYRSANLTPAMDLFSLGCVIAEMCLEGRQLFTLSQLLQFRNGQYDPLPKLDTIQDVDMRNLVAQLISLEPENRMSASHFLEAYKDKCFPPYFYTTLHPLLNLFDKAAMRAPTDSRIVMFAKRMGDVVAACHALDAEAQSDLCMLVGTAVCACVRSLTMVKPKLLAIELIMRLAEFCNDDVKLNRFLPYLIFLIRVEHTATVRAEALMSITKLLEMVEEVQATDAPLFPAYIFPNLQPMATDPQLLCRRAFTQCFSRLCGRALYVLEYSYAKQTKENSEPGHDSADEEGEDMDDQGASLAPTTGLRSFDEQLEELRTVVESQFLEPLINGSAHTKVDFVTSQLKHLCQFLGAHKARHVLLPHISTFLNDHQFWHLRASFFDAVKDIAFYLGPTVYDSSLSPFIDRCLQDSEEFVVLKTLETVAELIEHNAIPQVSFRHMLKLSAPRLLHPNTWLRNAAINVIAKIYNKGDDIFTLTVLGPLLEPYFTAACSEFSISTLQSMLHPPLPRALYDHITSHSDIKELMMALTNWTLRSEVAASTQQWNQRLLDSFEKHGKLVEHANRVLLVEQMVLKENASRLGARHRQGGQEFDDREVFLVTQPPTLPPQQTEEERYASGPTAPFKMNAAQLREAAKQRLKPAGVSQAAMKPLSSAVAPDRLSVEMRIAQDPQTQSSFCVFRQDLDSYFERCYSSSIARELELREHDNGTTVGKDKAQQRASRWCPTGSMVGHLHEHTSAVNAIAVARDGKFFASASEDGTIKIWDCNRIEGTRVTNRSRISFDRDVDNPTAFKDICFVHGSHTLAAASADGVLQLVHIEHANKKATNVFALPPQPEVGTALKIDSFPDDSMQRGVVACCTSNAQLLGWDTRTRDMAWQLRAPHGHGLFQGLLLDPTGTWLLTGSARGIYNVWDLRFFVKPSLSWSEPSGAIGNLAFYPKQIKQDQAINSTFSPWVMSVVSDQVVRVWDVQSTQVKEVFATQIDPHTLRQQAKAPKAPSLVPPNSTLEDLTLQRDLAVPRARTAQEFFTTATRRDVLSKGGSVDMHEEWRAAPESVKAPFIRSARQDLIRYKQDLDRFVQGKPALPALQPSMRPIMTTELSDVCFVGQPDGRIHAWNTISPKESRVLHGVRGALPGGVSEFMVEPSNGVLRIQERELDDRPQRPPIQPGPVPSQVGHRAAIRSLGTAMSAQGTQVLLAGDTEGVIKLWK